MTGQTWIEVVLTVLLALLVVACLPEPKTACLTSDDCSHLRVCIASICRDPSWDTHLDAGRDSPSPDDGDVDASIDVAIDRSEPLPEDGSSPDGPAWETAMDFADVPLTADATDAGGMAETVDAWDASRPPGCEDGCASLDLPLPSDAPFDVGLQSNDSSRGECDGACDPPSIWTLVGGAPVSGPGATRWGPGHNIDVFWRGADDHLKHKYLVDERGWSAEEDLGGTLASEPAATSRTTQMRDVFWRGVDNRLKHRWYPYGDGWSPEEDLGGTLASSPAAASWGTLALHVFWRGPDGLLKQKLLDYRTDLWTDEIDLGIPVQGDPAAVYRNNGLMDVFWRGSGGTLLHVWTFDGMNWSGIQDLGRTIAADSSPTATSRQFGWLDVFWKAPDGRLRHVWMTPDDMWSLIEEDLGGKLAASPDAISWGTGRLDVFAKDAVTGQLAHLLRNREATLTLNDADPAIAYSADWLYSSNRPFVNYRDDVHYTMANGAYFEHSFTGTGIDYVTDYEASSGQADVYVDGAFQASVNCSRPTRMVQQIVYSKGGLPFGVHTIKVVKANGDLMVLDALRVHP